MYKGIALFLKSTYEGQVRQRTSCIRERPHVARYLAKAASWSGRVV